MLAFFSRLLMSLWIANSPSSMWSNSPNSTFRFAADILHAFTYTANKFGRLEYPQHQSVPEEHQSPVRLRTAHHILTVQPIFNTLCWTLFQSISQKFDFTDYRGALQVKNNLKNQVSWHPQSSPSHLSVEGKVSSCLSLDNSASQGKCIYPMSIKAHKHLVGWCHQPYLWKHSCRGVTGLYSLLNQLFVSVQQPIGTSC